MCFADSKYLLLNDVFKIPNVLGTLLDAMGIEDEVVKYLMAA